MYCRQLNSAEMRSEATAALRMDTRFACRILGNVPNNVLKHKNMLEIQPVLYFSAENLGNKD